MSKDLKTTIYFSTVLMLLCMIIAYLIPSGSTLALAILATMGIVVILGIAILREK
jgi:hypothetical protein